MLSLHAHRFVQVFLQRLAMLRGFHEAPPHFLSHFRESPIHFLKPSIHFFGDTIDLGLKIALHPLHVLQ